MEYRGDIDVRLKMKCERAALCMIWVWRSLYMRAPTTILELSTITKHATSQNDLWAAIWASSPPSPDLLSHISHSSVLLVLSLPHESSLCPRPMHPESSACPNSSSNPSQTRPPSFQSPTPFLPLAPILYERPPSRPSHHTRLSGPSQRPPPISMLTATPTKLGSG